MKIITIILLVSSFVFGQNYSTVYKISKSVNLKNSLKGNTLNYVLNPQNNWDSLVNIASIVDIEYTINFKDSVITKKVNGSRVAYSKFKLDNIDFTKSTGSSVMYNGGFVIKYEYDFKEFTLALIDGFQYDMVTYEKTGVLSNIKEISYNTPVFLEYSTVPDKLIDLTAYFSYEY